MTQEFSPKQELSTGKPESFKKGFVEYLVVEGNNNHYFLLLRSDFAASSPNSVNIRRLVPGS